MSCWSVVFYAVLFIAAAIYLFYKRQFSYFEKEGIPYIKPSFPLGNMEGVTRNVHIFDRLEEIFNKLKHKGKVVGFYNITSPIYLITDLEIMKNILIKDFNNFVNRGAFVNEEKEPLTGHLFSIEDERWRFLRNKLSPVFTSGKLKNMYTVISRTGENLVKAIEKKGSHGTTLETKNIANRFTVDIISSVAFGMDANTLNDEHPELMNIFKEVFGNDSTALFLFFFLFAFPNFSKKIGLRQFSKKISDFFMDVVAGNITYREGSKDQRNDFLDMLIQLKNKGSIDGEISTETKKLTMNEILAQAFLFFFAGSDTSSTVISFSLIELAFNQDIQDKLRAEIKEKTKDTNGEITYEIMQDLTYLNQVINESLRMHGPVPFILRKAKEDYKVPDTDVIIKKDQTVWVPTVGFHFDDRYWKNPHTFDPERFNAEETAKRPAQCFFPFGDGPRNCIGMRLGLLNAKFGVAAVIKNFKVTADPKMEYPIKMNPRSSGLEPVGGFLLKYEKI